MSFDSAGQGAQVGGAYFGIGVDISQLERDLDRAEAIARDRARRIQQQLQEIRLAGESAGNVAQQRVTAPRPINVRQRVIVTRTTRVVDAASPGPPRPLAPERQTQQITVQRRYSIRGERIPNPNAPETVRQTQEVQVTRNTRVVRQTNLAAPRDPPRITQQQQIDITRTARVTEAPVPTAPRTPGLIRQSQQITIIRSASATPVTLPPVAQPPPVRQQQRINVQRTASVSATPSLPPPADQPELHQSQDVTVSREFHLERQDPPRLPPVLPARVQETQDVEIRRQAQVIPESQTLPAPIQPPRLDETQDINIRRVAHVIPPAALPVPPAPGPVQQTQQITIARQETATTRPAPAPEPPPPVQQTQEVKVTRRTEFQERAQEPLPPAPVPPPIQQTQEISVTRQERVTPPPALEPPAQPPSVKQTQDITVERSVHATGGQVLQPPSPPRVQQTQEIDVERETHVIGASAISLPEPEPQQPIHQTQQVTVQRDVHLEQRARALDLPAPTPPAPVQQTQDVTVRRNEKVVPTPEIAPPPPPPAVNQSQAVEVTWVRHATDSPLADPVSPKPVEQNQTVTVQRRRQAQDTNQIPAPVAPPPVQQEQLVTVDLRRKVGKEDPVPTEPPAPPPVQQEQNITIARRKLVVTEPTPPPQLPERVQQEQPIDVTRIERVDRVVPPPAPTPQQPLRQTQDITVERKYEVKPGQQPAPPGRITPAVTEQQISPQQLYKDLPGEAVPAQVRAEFERLVRPEFERLVQKYGKPDDVANSSEIVADELKRELGTFTERATKHTAGVTNRQYAVDRVKALGSLTLGGLEVPEEKQSSLLDLIQQHSFAPTERPAQTAQQQPRVVIEQRQVSAPSTGSPPPPPPDRTEIASEPSPSRSFTRPTRTYGFEKRGDTQQMQVGPEGATVSTFLGPNVPPETQQLTRQEAAARLRFQHGIQFQRKPPARSTVPGRIFGPEETIARAPLETPPPPTTVEPVLPPAATVVPAPLPEPGPSVVVPPPQVVQQVAPPPPAQQPTTPARQIAGPALSTRETPDASHLISMETGGVAGRQYYVASGQLESALRELVAKLPENRPDRSAYIQARQPSGDFGPDVRVTRADVERQIRELSGEPEPTPTPPAAQPARTTRTRRTQPQVQAPAEVPAEVPDEVPAEPPVPPRPVRQPQTPRPVEQVPTPGIVRLYRTPEENEPAPTAQSDQGRLFTSAIADIQRTIGTGQQPRVVQVDVPREVAERNQLPGSQQTLLPAGYAARAEQVPLAELRDLLQPRTAPEPVQQPAVPPAPPRQTELVLAPKVDQAQLEHVETQVQQAATAAEKTVARPVQPAVAPIDPNLLVRPQPPAPQPAAPPAQRQAVQPAAIQQIDAQAAATDEDRAALQRLAAAVETVEQREIQLAAAMQQKTRALGEQQQAAGSTAQALQDLATTESQQSRTQTQQTAPVTPVQLGPQVQAANADKTALDALSESVDTLRNREAQLTTALEAKTAALSAQATAATQTGTALGGLRESVSTLTLSEEQLATTARTASPRPTPQPRAPRAPRDQQAATPQGPTAEEQAFAEHIEDLRTSGLVLPDIAQAQQPQGPLILPESRGTVRTGSQAQQRIADALQTAQRPEDIGLVSAGPARGTGALILPGQGGPPGQLVLPGQQQGPTQPLILPPSAPPAAASIPVPAPPTVSGRVQGRADQLYQQLLNAGFPVATATQQVQSFFGVAPTTAAQPTAAPVPIPTVPTVPTQSQAQATARLAGAPYSTLSGRLVARPSFTVPPEFQGSFVRDDGSPGADLSQISPGRRPPRPPKPPEQIEPQTLAEQIAQVEKDYRPYQTTERGGSQQQRNAGFANLGVLGGGNGLNANDIRLIAAVVGVPLGINLVAGIGRDLHGAVQDIINQQIQAVGTQRQIAATGGPQALTQAQAGFQQFQTLPDVRGTQVEYLQTIQTLQRVGQQYHVTAQQSGELTVASGQLARIYGTDLPTAGKALADVLGGNVEAAQQLGVQLTDEYGRLRSVGVSFSDLVNLVGRNRAEQQLLSDVLANVSTQIQNTNQASVGAASSLDKIAESADRARNLLNNLTQKPFQVVVDVLANIVSGFQQTPTTPAGVQHPIGQAPNTGVQAVQQQILSRAPQGPAVAGGSPSFGLLDELARNGTLGSRFLDNGVTQSTPSAIPQTGPNAPVTVALVPPVQGAATQPQTLGQAVGQTVQRPVNPAQPAQTPAITSAAGLDFTPTIGAPPLQTAARERIATVLQAAGIDENTARLYADQSAAAQDLTAKQHALAESLKSAGANQAQADALARQAIAATNTQTDAVASQITVLERLRLVNQQIISQPGNIPSLAGLQRQGAEQTAIASAAQGPDFPLRQLTPDQAENIAQRNASNFTLQRQQQQIAGNAQNDVRAQLEASASTRNEDAQQELQQYDQRVAGERAILAANQQQAQAQNAQAQVQSQVDIIQSEADQRRLSAQSRLNQYSLEQIQIQDQLAPLLLREANLRDQITLATQQNLDLEERRLQAQLAANPATQALSALNFTEQQATQRAVVGQVQKIQGQQPEFDLSDQIQTIIGAEYQRPGLELANLEAQRPVQVTEEQQQAFQLQQQLNALPAQRELQGVQQAEIPLQAGQRDVQAQADALTRAIQATELANAPALIEAQTELLNARLTEIKATLDVTQAQAALAGAPVIQNTITVAANVNPDPAFMASIQSALTSASINALNQARTLSSSSVPGSVPGARR